MGSYEADRKAELKRHKNRLLENGKWYNFDGNGIMRANQWVRNTNNEHVWYYVGSDGAMVKNTTINGYFINANGECIC